MENYIKALQDLRTTKNKLDKKSDSYTILLINEEIEKLLNDMKDMEV
jgi:hypothetical protein